MFLEAVRTKRPLFGPDTEVIPDIDQDTLRKLCPPYKVILHNDDHNPMDLVIRALTKSVPSLTEEAAIEIMYTAHTEGSAIVIACPQETAEFYQERIMSFGLTCTIEPDE